MEVKHWERRSLDIALYEINQEYNVNRRINGLISLKERKNNVWRIGNEE